MKKIVVIVLLVMFSINLNAGWDPIHYCTKHSGYHHNASGEYFLCSWQMRQKSLGLPY